jgi:hypothetical protein
MYSMHLDGVLCTAAWWAGMDERVLRSPLRVYHLEHYSGYTPAGWQRVADRIRSRGIPILTQAELTRLFAGIRWSREVCTFNGLNWGLAGECLPEKVPVGR